MNKIRKAPEFCRSRRCTAGMLAVLIVMTMLVSSCSNGVDYISRSFFAMDTVIEVKLASDTEGADEIFAECVRLAEEIEGMLSAEDGTSEIARFNVSAGGITVSREVGELFELAALIQRASGGAFDPTTYPTTLLWRAAAESGEMPDDEQRAAAVAKCGMDLIEYDPEESFLGKSEPWVMLDLGGIGKGYAEARIAECLADRISYGVLSFGGNITVIGERPGGNFTIALRDPESYEVAAGGNSYSGRNGRAGKILMSHGFVSVSGGYERYFKKNGKTYHHIIDPKTGYPADSGIHSSTIVSSDGTLADGLSTSLFIMGLDKAEQYWKAHSGEFDFVLEADDGKLYVTDGISGQFTSSRDVTVIHK